MSEPQPDPALVQVQSVITDRLGALVEEAILFRDQLTLRVRPSNLHQALRLLKEDPQLEFHYLVDILGQERTRIVQADRFEVLYILYSFNLKKRVRIKTAVPAADPRLPTATNLWPAADWFERETYDMYGVEFTGHPDLRRILTWEGFEGHPLRKDFPFRPREEVSQWQRSPDELAMMRPEAGEAPARPAVADAGPPPAENGTDHGA